MELVGQFFGLVSFAAAIVMLQTDDRKKILWIQVICNGAFVIHYALLGAYTGAAMNVIAGSRTFIYSLADRKKWAASVWWTVGFLILCVIFGAMTWAGPVSLLSIASVAMKTLGQRCRTPRNLRRIYLPCSLLVLTYNILMRSVGGTMTEAAVTVSSLIAMWRFDRKKT